MAATATVQARYVALMAERMVPGEEQNHLKDLISRSKHRIMDIRNTIEGEAAGLLGPMPYPAFRWQWRTAFQYAWKTQQHINLLEMSAALTSLRRRSRSPAAHGGRFLHVVDSLVCAAALAKGRAGSIRLNRLLRRWMAVVIAADFYPVVFWTISRWNAADAASRRFLRRTNAAP